MKKYVDESGLQYFAEEFYAKTKSVFATKSQVGSPLVAATAEAMTDTSKIYVYTGSETGYVAGNWYYFNGSAWASGGVYNSVAVQTDDTLSVEGMAADAKATGEAISAIEGNLVEIDATLTESGKAADAEVTGELFNTVNAEMNIVLNHDTEIWSTDSEYATPYETSTFSGFSTNWQLSTEKVLKSISFKMRSRASGNITKGTPSIMTPVA